MKNSPKKIDDAHLCVGCGICKAVFGEKIRLSLNEFGRFNVSIDSLWGVDDDRRFRVICPVMTQSVISEEFWGRCITAFYGWSNDSEIRFRGSSGGVISQTCIYLLEEKRVDAVLHICEDTINPISNKYQISTNKEDIIRAAGSRYAPSVLLSNLNDVFYQYKRIAIVGKPCDIRALYNYLKEFPEFQENIVYTFSFFCGGLPSRAASLKLLNKMGTSENELAKLTYRGNGWPGYAIATQKNGKQFKMTYAESWGEVLGRDIHRYCKFCIDGIGELADFSCGDGWYSTESGYPSHEEMDGRNIILTHSDNGLKLLKEMVASGNITLQDVDNYQQVLDNIQPGQFSRRQLLYPRVVAMKACFQFLPKYPISTLRRWSKSARFSYRIKVGLGTVKRLIKHKL